MITKQIIPDLTNFDFSDVLNNICITNRVTAIDNISSPIDIGNRIFPNLIFCDVSLYHDTSNEILYSTAILHGGLLKDDVGYFTDPAYYLILLNDFVVQDIKKYWLTDNTQSQMGKDETIGIPTQSMFSAEAVIPIDFGLSSLHISIGGLDFTQQGGYIEPIGYIEDSCSLWAWGSNYLGVLGLNDMIDRSSPVQIGNLTDQKHISNGHLFSMVIKSNGNLWAWGYNDKGQLGLNDRLARSSPTQIGSLTDQDSISCGKDHVLAVKLDGTLQSQGYNSQGQLGQNDTVRRSSPVQVGLLNTWLKVASGETWSLAIKTDGTLWGCGNNWFGQLGQKNQINRSSPVQIGSDTNWKEISCNKAVSLAIKTNGSLQAWGSNNVGQLGLNDRIDKSSPTQVGLLTDQSLIATGYYHNLAIKTDGTLQSWGYGYYGQLGQNNIVKRSSPVQVGSDTDQESITCGFYISAAIKTDGTLQTQGDNRYGELGLGNSGWTHRSSPTQVGDLNTWVKICSGTNRSGFTATMAKPIFPTGDNIDLGINKNKIKDGLYSFNPISGYYSTIVGEDVISARFGHGICECDNNIIAIVGGGKDQTVVDFQDYTGLRTNFENVEWFSGNLIQLEILEANTGDTTQFGGGILEEQLTNKPSGQDFGDTSTSGEDGLYLKVQYVKNLDNLILDLTNQFSARCVVHLPDQTTTIFDDSLTPPFRMDFDPDGTTVCVWSKQPRGTKIKQVFTFELVSTLQAQGNNYYGKLGLNDLNPRSSPTQIGTDTDQNILSVGYEHTLALKLDGSLQTQGKNYYGQQGLNDEMWVDRSSPTQIGNDIDQSKIYCGYNHSIAIKTDGSLQSWGYNSHGELGQNDIILKSSPTQVGADINQKEIVVSISTSSAYAIKLDDSLWAWGYNGEGQLGLNNTEWKSSPTQVGSDTDQSLVINSGYNTLAVKSNNTLQAWGRNNYGQLGQNDIINRSSPTQVGSLTDWSLIVCSTQNTHAIKTDGSLQSWGYNYYGGLGLGDIIYRSSPVQVGELTDQKEVKIGYNQSIAIKTDGTLQTWGRNSSGELGMGLDDIVDRSSPVQVGSDTNQKNVNIGSSAVFAMRTDGSLQTWGHNNNGQLGWGEGFGLYTGFGSPKQIGSRQKKVFNNHNYMIYAIRSEQN